MSARISYTDHSRQQRQTNRAGTARLAFCSQSHAPVTDPVIPARYVCSHAHLAHHLRHLCHPPPQRSAPNRRPPTQHRRHAIPATRSRSATKTDRPAAASHTRAMHSHPEHDPAPVQEGRLDLHRLRRPLESHPPSEPGRDPCRESCREPGRVGPAHHGNHVHTLLTAPPHLHGKQIRKWLKRWLSQSLTQAFGPPPKCWWAQAGSTKPIKNKQYLINATNYINKQRTSTK